MHGKWKDCREQRDQKAPKSKRAMLIMCTGSELFISSDSVSFVCTIPI